MNERGRALRRAFASRICIFLTGYSVRTRANAISEKGSWGGWSGVASMSLKGSGAIEFPEE